MRPQSIIAIALALVCGGSAAVGVRQYVGLGRPARPETTTVVVASMNIARGNLVNADQITTREFPKEHVPAGAILKADDAVGRAAYTSIVKDETILDSKLSPKGVRGMASFIPEGMRAHAISTANVASGVAGFILPGDKVDVLLTTTSDGTGDNQQGMTQVLLQNVEILAVGPRIEAPAENRVSDSELRSVTLLVTLDQSAKLTFGESKGTLRLTLRNEQDKLAANIRPITGRDLNLLAETPTKPWDERLMQVFKTFGEALAKRPVPPPAAAAAQPEPQRQSIRTIRGNSEGTVVVTPVGKARPVAPKVADTSK
jgi:pilus assembly protein CpaB